MTEISGIRELLSIVLGASKDAVYREVVEEMHAAFQELIRAEADARRSKTRTLILAMAKYDREIERFKREYDRITGQLTPEGQAALEDYLEMCVQKRKDLVREKNTMKGRR